MAGLVAEASRDLYPLGISTLQITQPRKLGTFIWVKIICEDFLDWKKAGVYEVTSYHDARPRETCRGGRN
ncbi:hypothetical protein N7475_006867 [Penicillium sp. IBT 31633x]|nr:hypothetical protein N7475_006867 [Penicillium sp. IBT 31633x]